MKKALKTNWKKLDALTDETIDYSDIPELDDDFFKNAVLMMPDPKITITIRLDSDVLAWFKKKGKRYQTRINSILRAYMKAHLHSAH